MNRSCFTRDELHAFTLGKLNESQALSIEQHLDNCAVCEETVAVLDDATDSMLRQLRTDHSEPTDEQPSAKEYQQAIHELKQIVLSRSSDLMQAASSVAMEPMRLRDYELLEPLGAGGMGTVYRARHTRLETFVALKLLPTRHTPDELAVHRFQREMRAIGQLDHPSIVRAMDAGEVDGHHFLAMELVLGVDLGKLVRQTGSLSCSNACELVRQAALGMQYAHERGTVHRDLKPSNLMLTEDGRLKILDLGLALLTAGETGTVDELTTMGQLMGTLDYMAPEQFGDSHAVDQRVDVYGLGATLYKLLTGFAPYSGEQYQTPLQKLRGLAVSEPINIREHRSEIASALAETIHDSLARDVEQRIQTMAELAERLEPYCQDADLPALWSERSPRIVTDHPPAASLPRTSTETTSPDAASPKATPAAVRGGEGGFGWPTTLGFFASVVALGLVFFVLTNRGTLKIESPRSDLSLEILRAGEPYKSLTLNKNETSWTLGLGDYEVRLKEALDGLRVEDGKFTLRRGDQHVVTISHSDPVPHYLSDEATEPPPNIEVFEQANPESLFVPEVVPTFEGLSFDLWLQRFLSERSPKMRGQSAQAMLVLADSPRRQKLAIDSIFENTTTESRSTHFENATTGTKTSIYLAIGKYLREDPFSKFPGLRKALESEMGSTVARAVLDAETPTDPSIRKQLDELIDSGLRSDDTNTVVYFATCAIKHSDSLKEVASRLRSIAARDSQLQPHLTLMIVALGEQNDGDIQTLERLAVSGANNSDQHQLAFSGLLWLGPKAASAADALTAQLREAPLEGRFHLPYVMRHINRALPELMKNRPAHLASQPMTNVLGLPGAINSGGSVGMEVVQIATLACLGSSARKAVPILLEKLEARMAERRFTWFEAVKNEWQKEPEMYVLVHALTQITPERFLEYDMVWSQLLGEKRIPFQVGSKSRSADNDNRLDGSIHAHIEEQLAKYPLDLAILNRKTDDIGRDIIRHPAVSKCSVGIARSGLRIHVAVNGPVALLKVGDLVPITKEADILDPAWFSASTLESLPRIVVEDLPENPGSRFESKVVRGAVRVATAIRSFNGKSPLTTIRADHEQDGQYLIENESGTWSVRWGHAPGNTPVGEKTESAKLKALQDVLGQLYQQDLSQEIKITADVRFAETKIGAGR